MAFTSGRDLEYRILSRPMKLIWAGWETDTLKLQQAGWELSAQQDYAMDMLRIAMRHKHLNVVGMSNGIDYRQVVHAPLNTAPFYDAVNLGISYRIEQQCLNFSPEAFNPIDATPRMTDRTIHHLEELQIFKTVNQDAKEIYLSEASMSDILNVALSKQDDRQAEIRQRMIKDQEISDMTKRDSNVQAELRLVI